MKKSERNLLVSAALLIGILIAVIGFVDAMAVLFWCAVAAFVCCLFSMFLRALKQLGKGENRI